MIRSIVAILAASCALSAYSQEKKVENGVVAERDVEYGKAGERSLKLDLYYTEATGERPRPVIVWIHGGGWRNGDKSSGAGRLKFLVANGNYVGVSVGYRLTGEAIWPAQIHDCKAAIRWIRANAKKYNLDPDKIGVWGNSAGGHLVSLLGTSGNVKDLEGTNGHPDFSSRVNCVVDFCGPSNFLTFGEHKPAVYAPMSPESLLFGGSVKEKVEEAKLASPVTHVSADDPPFLIVNGTEDTAVPIPQAEEFYAALKKATVDATFVKMVGGGHGIGGAEVLSRVQAFLDKHLRGENVKVSAEPIQVKD